MPTAGRKQLQITEGKSKERLDLPLHLSCSKMFLLKVEAEQSLKSAQLDLFPLAH